jgi:hypothetical protein
MVGIGISEGDSYLGVPGLHNRPTLSSEQGVGFFLELPGHEGIILWWDVARKTIPEVFSVQPRREDIYPEKAFDTEGAD